MTTLMQPDAIATPAPASAAGADGGPRLYGVIDVIRPDRIAGWAIDRADSRAALWIDVTREGRPAGTVRADRVRKDLERGGVGSGRYGFAFDLAPPLEPGFEFTLAVVARAEDGTTTELRRAGAAEPEGGIDRRLLERIFAEVAGLAHGARPAEGEGLDALAAAVQRLEVVQARIEATLAGLDAPAPPAQTGLKLLLGVALTVAIGSLALGVVSMLWP